MNLVHNPKSVHQLMLKADLAISAGGQTLYELACMGCPTVAISVASNQVGHMKALEMAGILAWVGHAQEEGVIAQLGDGVLSLASNPAQREAVAAVGQKLVDGHGALRVATEIVRQAVPYIQINSSGWQWSHLS